MTCRANGKSPVSIAVMITSPISVGVCADGNAHLIYAHGRDVRIKNLLTHTYRDLAKSRLSSVIGVDCNFKEGMVSGYSFVYVSVQQAIQYRLSLYCIACCLIACLSGCLQSILALCVLDCRSILLIINNIEFPKSLLTTVMRLLPFSLH